MRYTMPLILAMLISPTVITAQPTALTTQEDKQSYAMGVLLARSIEKNKDLIIHPNLLQQGIHDVFNHKNIRLSKEDIKTTLAITQQQLAAKKAAQQQHEATMQETNTALFLKDNKQQAGVIETASGLQYKILVPGTGIPATSQDTVTVEYTGKLIEKNKSPDQMTVFDATKPNQPRTFPVNALIKGWQEALQLMKPGSTWELFIPSHLAYGAAGIPGTIPKNALLYFKMTLLAVHPAAKETAAKT